MAHSVETDVEATGITRKWRLVRIDQRCDVDKIGLASSGIDTASPSTHSARLFSTVQ